MTITIRKKLYDETGSISIEAAFIAFFFGIVLSFTLYQSIMYVQNLKVNKLASQLVEVVSQRNIFYSGKDLSQSDVIGLESLLNTLVPDFSKKNITVYIEELAYATHKYNVVEISDNGRFCQIKTRLDNYGINVITAYGKSNAIYRVTVCLKNAADFFVATPEVVVGVSLQPGHHH